MAIPRGPKSQDEIIAELLMRVRELESPRRFRLPMYETDPSAPQDGDAWYNRATNQFSIRVGNVTRRVNTS